MTFLFIGLDSFDDRLCEEFNVNEKLEDTPVRFKRLEQNLPDIISKQGQDKLNTGHWTFYVWPAIASGQTLTPEMRQEHPSPSEVEYPLKLKYLQHAPKSILQWVRNRLKGRPRYKSFVWDDFENVKIINFPMHLPEYNENAELVRDDAISRDYGPEELELLKAEINSALERNFDAIFVVTRAVDCVCHGATHPGNYDSEDVDEWFTSSIGKDFNEVHENGMDIEDFADNNAELDDCVDSPVELKQQILDHVGDSYDEAVELLKAVNWEQVDDHVVVSDHGFQALGAGSVNAHGRGAVLSCSFGYWRKMSEFIDNWRPALLEAVKENNKDEEGEEFKEENQDEKIKQELEALGYT